MSVYLKIILILLGLAYLISPVDIIPDVLIPYLGWLDDGAVIWSIYYLIRHGELPWFLFKRGPGSGSRPPGRNGRKTTGPDPGPGSGPRPGPSPGQGPEKRSGPSSGQGPGNGPAGKKRSAGASRRSTNKPGPQTAAPPKSPHEILGIGPDADWPAIQAAYRERIKKYHPDKVSHLGDEFSDLANEKFKEIQQAFDRLKAAKGPGKKR